MTTPKSFNLLRTATVLALLSFGAVNVFAQATASGTIQGTVFDQTQAVIVGADVVITNKATGDKRTAVTNDEGNYRFDLLSAGNYSMNVTKQGFAATVRVLDLLIGQTVTVNSTLTPGSTTEVVEVTGAAPIVDIAKTGVSTNVTPTRSGRIAHGRPGCGQSCVPGAGGESGRLVRPDQESLRDPFGQRRRRPQRERHGQRHRQQGQHGRRTGDAASRWKRCRNSRSARSGSRPRMAGPKALPST